MKNSLWLVLPVALLLDLLIPFLLAPSYKGYQHLSQVMSVLGNEQAPLHTVYNIWLVTLGIFLIIIDVFIYPLIAQHSKTLAILICSAILIYAVGGCILSGIFSVGESKRLVTFAQKVHGYGSVIGFMVLTFVPLLLGLYGYKAERMAYATLSFSCFALALLAFSLFIMADKPYFQHSIIAYEGLWQRLSLFFMYFPIACIHLLP